MFTNGSTAIEPADLRAVAIASADTVANAGLISV
jgi:hypothetical protein